MLKLEKKLVDNLLEIQIFDKSQLDELETLKQKVKDTERLHSSQLEAIKATSSKEKEELEQNIQLLQSQNKQLEQQLEEERSQQQQLESSYQSQIEEKESAIIRLHNSAKSQQEKIDDLTKKLEDKERSHSNQLSEIQASSIQDKEELKQQLEQEKSHFNQQQANLQAAPAKIAEQEAINAQLREQIEQLISEAPTIVKDKVELISVKGIDYRGLRDLLEQKKWKEADEETLRVMLEAVARRSERWLRSEDIYNFPCDDLRTINQLWLHYSGGNFGFSVQKEIYESLGGTRKYDEKVWDGFGNRVGWRKGDIWLNYSELTFTLNAPRGNLPFITVSYLFEISMRRFWRISSLAQRLVTCRI